MAITSHVRRPKFSWKKTSVFTCAVLLPLPILVVSSYNIAPQDSIPLASIQKSFEIHHASNSRLEITPMIIGHRGSGGEAVVENTRGAIEAGIRAGADWIEIDVRQAGGQLVLFHDETVACLTGEPVEKAARVKDLDLERLRDRQGTDTEEGDRIISLSDALQIENVNWVIDIKDLEIKTELLKVLEDQEIPKHRIVLQGLFEIIQEYKDEGYALAYAAGWNEGANKTRFLFGHGFIAERCEALGSDLEYLSLPSVFVNRSLIGDVKKKWPDIRVWSWRAENEESWERNVGLGVDGLIVDDVKSARKAFPKGK